MIWFDNGVFFGSGVQSSTYPADADLVVKGYDQNGAASTVNTSSSGLAAGGNQNIDQNERIEFIFENPQDSFKVRVVKPTGQQAATATFDVTLSLNGSPVDKATISVPLGGLLVVDDASWFALTGRHILGGFR